MIFPEVKFCGGMPRKNGPPPPPLLAELRGLNGTSRSALQNVLKRLKRKKLLRQDVQTSTKAFTKELEERVNVDTQYGEVLQEMQLMFKLEENRASTWTYVNPFALLNWLSTRSQQFSDLISDCCGHVQQW